MSISDRLDKWITDSEEVLDAVNEGHLDPDAFTDDRAGRALAALRAVLDVCELIEKAHAANPKRTYEQGMEVAAYKMRTVITASLGEEAP